MGVSTFVPQHYECTVNILNSYVHVRVWDYWANAEADQYIADMRKVMATLRSKPWVVLADVTKSPPQSDYTQRVRTQVLVEASAAGMRRIAYVVESSLTQQQLKRFNINAHTNAGYFADRTAADAWLREATESG